MSTLCRVSFVLNPCKKIFRVEFNIEFLQHFKVFLFERLLGVVILLILDILYNRIDL